MEEVVLKKKGISGSTLKLIAIITMLIDHIGASTLVAYMYFHPEASSEWWSVYTIMRRIGRIAFPIFIFLLIEGFYHTRNRFKYARNLFIFGVLSEIPFDLAFSATLFDWEYQNVMFTLLLGFITMWVDDSVGTDFMAYVKSILCFVLCAGIAYYAQTDYGFFGVVAIYVLYQCRKYKQLFNLTGILLFSWETTAPIAFLFTSFYNGKRGISLKYLFYLFYPVHLLLLGFIRWYYFPY